MNASGVLRGSVLHTSKSTAERHPMTTRRPWRHESFAHAWLRRCLTIPVYLTLTVLLVALTPVLLPLVVVIDVALRRRFVLGRCLVFAGVFFFAEVIGMGRSLVLWVRFGGWRAVPSRAYLDANLRLQRAWASGIFGAARRIFAIHVAVEGDESLRPGPIIVLGRHASPLDNLIPAVFVADRHRLRLRWVINRWLLRDPCLDIVGNRLPNVFVETHSREPLGQSARVAALATGLTSDEGVLIFPEGALFSPARLGRAVTRLYESDAPEADAASRLRNVLPPRGGAFLAALAASPDADVVICEHRGLDVANDYRALIAGGLVGAELLIRFRRFVRTAIPADADDQRQWLFAQWQSVDGWISSEQTATLAQAPPGVEGGRG